MREAMTPEQFAALLGLPLEDVERYQAEGLLDPEGDGLLDDLDLVRHQVVHRQLDQFGGDAKELRAAIRDRRVHSMFGPELFEPEATLPIEEAAAQVGLEPEQVRTLLATLGLPEHSLRASGDEICAVLDAVRVAGLPWEAILAVTRALGDSMRRIADSEMRLVHVYMHERLLADGRSDDETNALIYGFEQGITQLVDPLLRRLHREYVLQASVEDAFYHLAESGEASLGTVEATIAFVDVASFTALAETSGDDVAAQVMDRIDTFARPLLLEHDGKIVKGTGDGFMLAFREPASAVRFAIDTQSALARDPDLPAIRAGINTGPVLYRTGDYHGGTVNVAARVTSAAMAGQILLTERVATAARDAEIGVEPVGVRMLRGVDEPLTLYRVRDAVMQYDPICGAPVTWETALRLSRGGVDFAFCSETCLQRFLREGNAARRP